MKNSIFCFAIACLLLTVNTAIAQFSVGAKGGISIPNLTSGGSDNNPLNTGYKSSLGPDGVIFGQYHFSSAFSLDLSLEYSSQGGKKHGKQALPVTPEIAMLFPPGQAPQYLWANFDADAKLNYLMLPILARYDLELGSRSAWSVYFEGGPFAALLLSAKTVTKGSSNVYADEDETMPLLPEATSFDDTEDIKDQLHKFNFGVAANIGLAYHFERSSIFIEGGGNYGFINIQKDKADGQNHTGAATARIGYAYTFGKHALAGKKVQDPKVFN